MRRVLDDIKYKANKQINEALLSTWLDRDTVKAFIREQTILQRYPFLLQRLVYKINTEISSRVKTYGT